MARLLEDLRAQIARHGLVVVTGAGVSVAVSGGVAQASWAGLLDHGISWVQDVCRARLPAGWAEIVRAQAASGDVEFMLSAAEEITFRLGGRSGGEFRRWLRESVGSLQVVDRRLVDSLIGLGVPLATTNYDGLVEAVTGWPPLTWLDGTSLVPMLRREERAVLHLHGYWRVSESVVLGIRSYEAVLGNEAAQALQRSLATMGGMVLVGFGAGLQDPNFSALRRWLASNFSGSEHRHFRLCRDDELAAVAAEHPPEERILPVGYGPNYVDLPEFLESLAPSRSAVPVKTRLAVRPAMQGLPPPRPHVNRRELLERLTQVFLAPAPSSVIVSGAPGIGKTALCIAAANSPEVGRRFNDRRWFVHADGVTDANRLMAGIAAALGLTHVVDSHSASLADRIVARLSVAPGLLILDNFETPWSADILGTEELLRILANVSGLIIAVTMRGLVRPAGINWADHLVVRPLSRTDARILFLGVAGPHLAADPAIDITLDRLDGMPLAIELFGHAAQGEPDLADLMGRWETERSSMLTRATGNLREVSVPVSIELSIKSPLMTDAGQRLLALLGQLPDGLQRADFEAVLPGVGRKGASTLRQLGLAYDETSRLRVLAPIREHILANYEPPEADLSRAVSYYCELAASLGRRVGGEDGSAASRRLSVETNNIVHMIRLALEDDRLEEAIPAVTGLNSYARLTGVTEPGLLPLALSAVYKAGDREGEARLLLSNAELALARSSFDQARTQFLHARSVYEELGDGRGIADSIVGLAEIALGWSDNEAASKLLEEARGLYERIRLVSGRAHCIHRMGDIALRRGDLNNAQARHEQARSLFEQVGDVRGQAHCTMGLGDIASLLSNYESAIANYNRGQQLYERTGDVRGRAHMLRGRGDIALAQARHDVAEEFYARARTLFEQVGDLRSTARCIMSAADAALASLNYETAEELYRHANQLSKQIGDPRVQAGCIRGIGDIHAAQSNQEAARLHWQHALDLYDRIADQYERGQVHRRLAHVAPDQTTRISHLAAARDAWSVINRQDLISDLDEEFRGLQ